MLAQTRHNSAPKRAAARPTVVLRSGAVGRILRIRAFVADGSERINNGFRTDEIAEISHDNAYNRFVFCVGWDS